MSSLCGKCMKAAFCESKTDISECEYFLDESGYYADICYECTGYGDDYYCNDDGYTVPACADCWVTERLESLMDEVSE